MFFNGSVYVYYNVNKEVFIELLSAPSTGRFVREKLIHYKYEQVSINDVE